MRALRPAKRMHAGSLVLAFVALVAVAGVVSYALAR